MLQILERYQSGQRSFVAIDLDDQVHDFNDTNFSGADFSNSDIVATFRNANLEGVNFTNANVKTCDFSGVNLKQSCFQGAALEGTIFEGANLERVSFTGASVFGYRFVEGERPI